MTKLLTALALTLVLTGCAGPNPIEFYAQFKQKQADCVVRNKIEKPGTAVIGMTADDAVLCGWGPPLRSNVTIVAGARYAQWVYPSVRGVPSSYLYFTNSVLTAIQN